MMNCLLGFINPREYDDRYHFLRTFQPLTEFSQAGERRRIKTVMVNVDKFLIRVLMIRHQAAAGVMKQQERNY
jgi:hypothetical protein